MYRKRNYLSPDTLTFAPFSRTFCFFLQLFSFYTSFITHALFLHLHVCLRRFVDSAGLWNIQRWMKRARKDPTNPPCLQVLEKAILVLRELPLTIKHLQGSSLGITVSKLAADTNATLSKDSLNVCLGTLRCLPNFESNTYSFLLLSLPLRNKRDSKLGNAAEGAVDGDD